MTLESDVPTRVKVLYESQRTRVSRLFLPGRTVIRKEPLGHDARQRLQRESWILERLRGIRGVAQLLDAPRYPGSLILEDAGDTSLAQSAKPLAAVDLIEVAVKLAQAVSAVHGRGVLHRNIASANVMLDVDGCPHLVAFGLATSLAEIRPEFTHHSQILGNLSYVAPEQTGRTGRPVDQRADLYALGATLYELATGTPPFGSGDPLRLTHDHLARVPAAPADVNPAVPQSVSAIILHSLEKEPDDRYQSAEGLIYDLQRCREGGAHAGTVLRVGEHDVPARLVPPSRLVGRDTEVATLKAAFDEALAGQCRGVLVSGAPGVGKTALINELRPMVTGSDGWFVAGKFDQFRRDLVFDAIYQAFRALGRLLLAEPPDELDELRERLLTTLGPNAGLATAVQPEFAALLGVRPEPGDPLTAQARTRRAAADVLRAVASRKRPVVLFVDDLQWAGRVPVSVIDAVLSEEEIEGLLLVGAYRDDDVDQAHPLAAPIARWREQPGVRHVQLANLPSSSLVTLLAEMLHVDQRGTAALTDTIAPHTHGNPYETVELVNTLRRESLLTLTSTGWHWDEKALRSRLDRSETTALSAVRLQAMPAPSRELVEVMACLGGRAELSLLQTASGLSPEATGQWLAPVLDEALLVVESGVGEAVRFRHDRIREAVLATLDGQRQAGLQLQLARRLAAVPELFAVAAEQYIAVIDAVDDTQERREVMALLRRAAEQAALVANFSLVEKLLTAALRIVDSSDTATLVELHTGRHAALYNLGRMEEADEDYRTIERLSTSALQRVDATCVQVRSLTNSKHFAEAIALGLGALRELGVEAPSADQPPALLNRQFDDLYRWLDGSDEAGDLARPDITDPKLLAVTRLLNAVFPTVFVAGDAVQGWVSLEAVRIWVEHGTARSVLGAAGYSAFVTIALRDDYSAAYRTMRRLLALGEARGYEPETSQVRCGFSHVSCWFEPIENGIEYGERAREGLVAGGDLAIAGYGFHITGGQLDCLPTLDSYVAEAEVALAFAQRAGSEQTGQWLAAYRRLAGVLLGESSASAGHPAPSPVDGTADSPVALFFGHLSRAIAAVIFDDSLDLTQHTAVAMQLLPAAVGVYATAVARLLRGLALATDARRSQGGERAAQLSELEEVIGWLAARAADAPMNFLHLVRLLEAEREWAVGNFHATVLAFDAARSQVASRQRPWHRALIDERAARFYLAHGLQQAGFELLARARQEYLRWGAIAKVDQLDWAYPALRPPSDLAGGDGDAEHGALSGQDPGVTTGTVDLLGILSASRALSSETDIERLHARVVDVLKAMTGATGVRLLLWSDDRQDWLLPDTVGGTTPVSGSGQQRAVPMSVLRFVQRAPKPLVVVDAPADDRFARDPYFAGIDRCSLLALPILNRGRLQAALLLENCLIRGAFTTERLDGIKLIASQLAVSLDNAQMYSQLAASRVRIVAAADQTRRQLERDLHDGAQQRLVSLALQVRMAQQEIPPEQGQLRDLLEQFYAQANEALQELRQISRGIHPAILTKGGLGPALRALTRRSPIAVELDVRVSERLPESVEVSAYYIVAEALTNVAKHAHASAVTVTVEADATVLRADVCDNGVGGADFGAGSGLIGLKDRAEALGGLMTLRSRPGAGTDLHVELPLAPASSGATD